MTAKPLGRTGKTVTDREAAKNAEEREGKTRRAHGLGLEFKIWNFSICSGASLAVCV